jgi:hypothetical protein
VRGALVRVGGHRLGAAPRERCKVFLGEFAAEVNTLNQKLPALHANLETTRESEI